MHLILIHQKHKVNYHGFLTTNLRCPTITSEVSRYDETSGSICGQVLNGVDPLICHALESVSSADASMTGFQLEKQHDALAVDADIYGKLKDLWEDVLGVDHVSQDKTFFDEGGHSLLAMRMLARVNKLFSIKVPFKAFYENATLQSFSSVVSKELCK